MGWRCHPFLSSCFCARGSATGHGEEVKRTLTFPLLLLASLLQRVRNVRHSEVLRPPLSYYYHSLRSPPSQRQYARHLRQWKTHVGDAGLNPESLGGVGHAGDQTEKLRVVASETLRQARCPFHSRSFFPPSRLERLPLSCCVSFGNYGGG